MGQMMNGAYKRGAIIFRVSFFLVHIKTGMRDPQLKN